MYDVVSMWCDLDIISSGDKIFVLRLIMICIVYGFV